MKGKSVLPVYRLEKHLGFNSKLEGASGSPKHVSLSESVFVFGKISPELWE
jgi:hypothetical protein